MKVDGACHCGQITFVADIEPERVVVCHCTDCQTLSGSAFRVIVFTREDGLTIRAGTVKTYLKIAHSGRPREQGCCATRAPRLDDVGATVEAGVEDRDLDLRGLWWCGQGDREHRRSDRDQENPGSSRAAGRGRDARVQTLRPGTAATTIAGPEGTRLTADPSSNAWTRGWPDT